MPGEFVGFEGLDEDVDKIYLNVHDIKSIQSPSRKMIKAGANCFISTSNTSYWVKENVDEVVDIVNRAMR